MGVPRLVLRHMLDPRAADFAAAAPIVDAVNIPCDELAERTHELPPRDEMIRVAADGELAERTVSVLAALERRAERVAGFEFGAGAAGSMPGGTVGRLWKPTAFLEETAVFPPGAALDIACGTGRDAVWLADRGWSVVGVDILPDALTRGRALAQRCLCDQRVRWVRADVEAARPPAEFRTEFDLITIFRFLHRPLISRLAEWLRPGGRVLCETFTTTHQARHGKPARREYVLAPGELRALFGGWRVEHYSEDWRGSAHTARICVRA